MKTLLTKISSKDLLQLSNHSFCQRPFASLKSINRMFHGLLMMGLFITLVSCKPSSDDEVVPVNTGEFITYKINGNEYSDKSLTSPTASANDFGLWSFIVASSSVGYDLKLYASTPQVGIFTSQSKKLTGEFRYIRSLTDVEIYTMTTGTLAFTAYDKNGFAEGTFSFAGKNTKGQTITITDGKFRMDVR